MNDEEERKTAASLFFIPHPSSLTPSSVPSENMLERILPEAFGGLPRFARANPQAQNSFDHT
jgi:hypothetical protein